jgi:hypothetical protein
MLVLGDQNEVRCFVEQSSIDCCALTYASDVCSKVRLLALMAPSLGNKADLAPLVARATLDLKILHALLVRS